MKKFILKTVLIILIFLCFSHVSYSAYDFIEWTPRPVDADSAKKDKVWKVRFSEVVDYNSLDIYVEDSSGNRLYDAYVYNDGDTVWVNPPKNLYNSNQIYTLYINNAKGTSGASLKSKVKLTFKVEEEKQGFNGLPDYIFSKQLTPAERELANLINDYRAANGVPRLPISYSLTKVARAHVRDTALYKPYMEYDSRGIQGNLHSWSGNGPWEKVIYTSDHNYSNLMWSKPSEFTNYKGNGYEISTIRYYGDKTQLGNISPAQALNSWQNSSGHNDVILENGIWSREGFKTFGIAIENGVSHVWFGRYSDPDGYLK